MVGTYKVLKLRLPSSALFSGEDAQIILRTNGTAMLSSVPGFDEVGQRFVCIFSGSATWNLDDKIIDQRGWSIAFQNYHPATTPTARECDLRNSVIGFLVLSRHAPYRLYQIVGDRDSDTVLSINERALLMERAEIPLHLLPCLPWSRRNREQKKALRASDPQPGRY